MFEKNAKDAHFVPTQGLQDFVVASSVAVKSKLWPNGCCTDASKLKRGKRVGVHHSKRDHQTTICSPVDLNLCLSVILVHERPYDVCVAIGGICNPFYVILMYSTRMHATITVLNMESAEALGNLV